MRATHSRLIGALSLSFSFAVACGGSNANDDDTTGIESTAGATETGDDAGDPIDLGPCEALIKCVYEIDPGAAEGLEMNYGPNGTCYTIPGQTVESCWDDCQDALDGWAMLNPTVPWCNGAECVSDADCEDPQAPSCWPNYECGGPCGNGRLDAGELCDPGVPGAQACTSECLLENHACSPMNAAGCAEGEKCAYEIDESGNLYFGCWSDITGPGELLDTCMAVAHCGLDAGFCMLGVEGCSGDFCCVPYCYLGETDLPEASCPGGLTCAPISEAGTGFLPGLESYGVCR